MAVLDYDKSQVRIVDSYPVQSLESQLEWYKEHGREKDKDKINKVEEYLKNNRR